jgi:hypothetical protein
MPRLGTVEGKGYNLSVGLSVATQRLGLGTGHAETCAGPVI